MRIFFLSFLSCLLLLPSCTSTETPILNESAPVNRWSTDKAWAVLDAQEHRDVETLSTLLHDSIWQVRRMAALALASVQDSSAAPYLVSSMRDSIGGVRAASAFALGFCGNADDAEDIIDLLRFEHDPTVRYAMWEAAGRAGDELSLKRMLDIEPNMKYDSLGLAWGLYGIALNGVQTDETIHRCLDLLLHPEEAVRLGAAHTLARTEKELLIGHKEVLSKWLSIEPSPEIRSVITRAFGKTINSKDFSLLMLQYEKADVPGKVNILCALDGLDDLRSQRFLQAATNDSLIQIAKTAASVLVRRSDFSPNQVSEFDRGIVFDEVVFTVLAAQLRGNNQKSRVASLIKERLDSSPNPYIKAHVAAITLENSRFSPVNDMTGMALSDSASLIEKTAATQALFNWFERNPKLKKEDLLALSKLLNSKDPGVLADVATFMISNKALRGNDQAQLAMFAEYSIGQLDLPEDMEAKLLLEQAIAHLRGTAAPVHTPPTFNHPIDRNRLDLLPNGQEYVMTTARGIVRLRTFVDEAPGSSLVFDSLVMAGYYDGKTFHRIIPNFVAQGGCPRGDGYGSMDWTLRTEIGLSRYETGSIGLASAGPDTESCQFFITYSSTPHLDGSYTRFGQVIDGMDIVNMLQWGDVINNIERAGDTQIHAKH